MRPAPCKRSIRTSQAGEGKIGCILSLLVMVAAVATGIKVVPVLYTDNSLVNFADDLAIQAGVTPGKDLDNQLRAKAKDLDIPEALAPGALSLTTSGPTDGGICQIDIKYSRTVDLYGIYPLVIGTDKHITKTYMNVK
jgi:hypothetical protein